MAQVASRHSSFLRSYHPSSPSLAALALKKRHSEISELGLRSHLPPDSNSKPDPNNPSQIPDQDWEIRTGRAIYVLQHTLPDFFHTGLVTLIDKATGTPRPSGSIPIVNANPLDNQPHNEDSESIYSPKIRLSYTPPVALPAPFPKTLHVEGLPLYMASSVFVRHTLNALYSDISVVLRKVVVNTPRYRNPSSLHTGSSQPSEPEHEKHSSKSSKRKSREKSLFIGLCVTGTGRVSGGRGEWQVNSTYTFSPVTGLIYMHTIDSIHPEPHQAVYDSLRSSLGNVFGLGLRGSGGARPNEAVCKNVSCGTDNGDGKPQER
ncbi:hypothetical protein L208DRAFT_1356231, partial [Tricholoma matsutake]